MCELLRLSADTLTSSVDLGRQRGISTIVDLELGMECALDAPNRAQMFTSKAALGIAHQRLGVLLSRRGRHRTALKHFDEALALRSKSWQRWSAADTLISRADALLEIRQVDQDCDAYVRSLGILEGLRDVRALEVRTRLASLGAISA
ncbi:tetratricopeptide repeat protein [Amycolatopsis sp. NPDC005961]|uniref:tetratricopeptide repeat protein n=1 Tax=Amycolatopsis sp. NPDC005961 TaxID=3156720 RepID=UPI0033ECC245